MAYPNVRLGANTYNDISTIRLNTTDNEKVNYIYEGAVKGVQIKNVSVRLLKATKKITITVTPTPISIDTTILKES